MNQDNYRFAATKVFRKFCIIVPLGLLFFAFVAATACETFENTDSVTDDETLRGGDSTRSCLSVARRIMLGTRPTRLSCRKGETLRNLTFRHGTLCRESFGCSVPASSSVSKVQQDCQGKQSCILDLAAFPFSCPRAGLNRTQLGWESGHGGAAGAQAGNPTDTIPTTALSVWYECRANVEPYSEKDLQGMLEQCRTRVSTLLPPFDSSARDAFMASHRAESNNTGNMRETGYHDLGEVAKTIALARPLLENANLNKLIGDKDLDVTLVRCAVLANILSSRAKGAPQLQPAELVLITDLLQDQDLMKQILIAGGPRGDRYGRALQIYRDIQSANPRANDGVFQKLAIAIGLEMAASEFIGTYDHLDPVSRYRFFEKSYLDGELIEQFADFSPWEYRQVINAHAPDEDLRWLREMLHNLRPDFIFNSPDRDRFVGIQSEEDIIPQEVVQFDENLPYSWYQQVLAKGGQCGAKARFTRNLLRSFGVPAWGFQVPSHAGIGYWTPSGWTSNLKVSWEHGYLKTGVLSEWMTARIFLLDAHARSIPDEYLKALRLQWIGDVLGEEDIDLVFAGRGGLWNALALNKKRIIDKDLYVNPPQSAWEAIPNPTESDKEITIRADGTMTIPAVATVDNIPNNGTLKVIVDRNNDFLLHYRRKENIVPFSYIVNVPHAGSYAMRAEVVTVIENQSLLLTVNDGQPATRVELPYTVGMWETSKPVTVSLAQGQNKLTFSRRQPEDKGTSPMWWYCRNYSDPDCGGITIRSFVLTPL